MRKLAPLFALLAAWAATSPALAPQALAQAANNTNPDIQFAHKAASGGFTEIELSQTALKKSARQDVKDFAQRMVDDHMKVNQEFAQLAKRKHLRLPTQPVGADAEEVRRISALDGGAFDQAYAAQMVQDHRKTVDAFEQEAKNGSVAPIKTLARQSLNTLRDHLAMAERLQQAVGEEKAQAGSPPPAGRPQ